MIVARCVPASGEASFKFLPSLMRARLFAERHKGSYVRIELHATDALTPRNARQAVTLGMGRLIETVEANPLERIALVASRYRFRREARFG